MGELSRGGGTTVGDAATRHVEAAPGASLGAFVVGPVLLERGSPGGVLSGTTFAAKDLFDVAGTRTGRGNPDWLALAPVAAEHSPAVAAMLAAGSDLLGKTVTDEFAFSLSGTNVHYGTPRNPAAPGRIPGGSSSGSASAVAGGLVDLALGTDTGGSIRVPASYCGIYGIRPSHGRIDRCGVMPLAPSFCTVGLFGRDPALLARGFDALSAGATDPDWSRLPGRIPSSLVVMPELFALADEGSRHALEDAANGAAGRLGLEVVVADLGDLGGAADLRAAFRTIQLAEAWQTHGEWLSANRPDLGPGVAERFEQASRVDPDDLLGARSLRERARRHFAAVLGTGGVLAQPAACGPAPLESGASRDEKNEMRARLLALTAPGGLIGAPVVSLPLARVEGLPVGLCLLGLPGDDEMLLSLALGLAAGA